VIRFQNDGRCWRVRVEALPHRIRVVGRSERVQHGYVAAGFDVQVTIGSHPWPGFQ
jgi:hypothetical protein